jgi:amidohydrolase
MEDVKLSVKGISKELTYMRRDFHLYPELGNSEFRTMDKICSYLESWGIEYKKGVAGTGVVALVRGKKSGRTVGVRADIDALPIKEEADVDFKSKNDGVMHACGHDAHTVIALGTAKILKSMEDSLSGNVKFFFQPAEETTGGAERMIKEGCLKDPDVGYVVGLHVEPAIEMGKVGIRYGKMQASSDEIYITIKGRSTHGAHPDQGIDPIFIASNVVMALQSVVSRNISPVNSAVLTLGTINGGTRGNIIPDEVRMEGTIRTLDEDTRKFMKERIRSIVEDVPRGLGGEGELVIAESYGALINDSEVVDVVKEAAEEFLGKENVVLYEYPSMGTEDFSYFAKSVKSCYFNLGCGNEKAGAVYPIHSSRFKLDEGCLEIGTALQVLNVLRLLSK